VALCTVSALGLPLDEQVIAAVEHAGRLLEAAGHTVTTLESDVFDPVGLGPFLHVVNAGLSEAHGFDWDLVEPHNRAGKVAAEAVDSLTLARSIAELQAMTRTIVSRFDDEFDLLVTPTMSIEPPPVGLLAVAHEGAGTGMPPMEVVAMAAFTAVFNITGQPAVSLPLHVSPSGLPVGVQIVAGPWREAQLVRVASQLEQSDPWAGRFPGFA
jgi:amidase